MALIADPIGWALRAEPVKDGPEIQVNTFTTDSQWLSDVSAADDGDFVVVWQSRLQDGVGPGIFGQRFDVSGARIDGEFEISQSAERSTSPAVAMGGAGDFVVAWEDDVGGFNADVKARLYDNEGTPGTEFVVGTGGYYYYYYYYYQQPLDVAKDASGGFVVVWSETYSSVEGRLYDDAGVPLDTQFTIDFSPGEWQWSKSVARNDSGAFVVAWADYYSLDVDARVYDDTGDPAGPAFQVGTSAFYLYYYSAVEVGISASGDFVVVWSDADGSGRGVAARRFDASGDPLGPEFRVNTTTVGNQSRPAVAMDDDGNFAIVWETSDGSGPGVVGRYYDSTGTPDGGEFQVNTTTFSSQVHPAVSMDGAGDFVVTWSSWSQDGSAWGVFAQRFCVGGVGASGCRPRVSTVTPVDGAVDIPLDTDIVVTFNEPIVPGTVDGTSFQVLEDGITPLAGAINISGGDTVATFDPDANLTDSTTYEVRLTSDIQDPEWDSLVEFSSTFQTVVPEPADVPLPDVSEEAPGLAPDSKTGAAVASLGNLDGDALGLDDVIIGAPGYTEGGGPLEVGAAAVYLGSLDETERTSEDIRFVGEAAYDHVGVAVAGDFDFNDDGLPDILIGAEQVDRTDPDTPVFTGNGRVYLIYFDPADVVHYPNLADQSTPPDVVSLSSVGVTIPGVVFEGEALGDLAGFSVAGGGLMNADLMPEIVIGAPGANVDASRVDAGKAYLIFGTSPALNGRTFNLGTVADGTPQQIPGRVYLGAAAGDGLGYTVAFPGDVVDPPGGEDLAIAAPFADYDPHAADQLSEDSGTTYLSSGGTMNQGAIESEQIGGTEEGAQVQGSQAGAQSGSSVAGGGDNLPNGEDDLLIGSPGYDNEGTGDEDAGMVSQTAGRLPQGTHDTGDIGGDPSVDQAIEGVTWIGAGAGDRLGTAVAGLGDVTNNGTDDIAMGAPFTDPGGLENAGTIYISDGPTAPPSGGFGGQTSVAGIGETSPGRQLTGETAGEQAGTAISGTGDIDGDGSNDVVVGSPGKDGDAGAASLIVESEELSTVLPNQPPVAEAGADQTLECVGGQAVATVNASDSFDPDGDTLTFEWFDNGTRLATGSPANITLGLGTHMLTLVATDPSGGTGSDDITIVVADSASPGITCPTTLGAECTSPSGAVVTLAPATSGDACHGSATITNDVYPAGGPDASGLYPIATTTVTFTATDASGLFSQCTTVVPVVDTTAPTVVVTAVPDDLWPPNHRLVDVHFAVTATDTCDLSPDIVLESASPSETEDAPGKLDGHTTDDIQNADLETPDFDVSLRAERLGGGPGRDYTLVYRATDDAGNDGHGSDGVHVPHDQGDVVEPILLTVTGGAATRIEWDPVPGRAFYHVVRGNLSNVRVSGSDVEMGSAVCIEAQSLDGTTSGREDPEIPPSGEAFFYAVEFVREAEAPSSIGTESSPWYRSLANEDVCRSNVIGGLGIPR